MGLDGEHDMILPLNLTWNLKISPWKRRFLLETIIFRFHVKFRGCMCELASWGRSIDQLSHYFSVCIYTPPNLTAKAPENGWLEYYLPFWDGLFSGAMLVSGRVIPWAPQNLDVYRCFMVNNLVLGGPKPLYK